jgi:hypothetical protein
MHIYMFPGIRHYTGYWTTPCGLFQSWPGLSRFQELTERSVSQCIHRPALPPYHMFGGIHTATTLGFFPGYGSVRLRGKTPGSCFLFKPRCNFSLLHQNDLQRQGVNTKKGRAATVMIVVTVPIVVTVSDDCDSDCCDCFDCYSLLAIVPVVSPVTPSAVSTIKTVMQQQQVDFTVC